MNKIALLEELRKLDEITLLELLDISSTEIVDNFLDKIDDRYTYIEEKISEEREERRFI